MKRLENLYNFIDANRITKGHLIASGRITVVFSVMSSCVKHFNTCKLTCKNELYPETEKKNAPESSYTFMFSFHQPFQNKVHK